MALYNNDLASAGIFRAKLLQDTELNTWRVYVPSLNNSLTPDTYKNNLKTLPVARFSILSEVLYYNDMSCWVVFEGGDQRYPVVIGFFGVISEGGYVDSVGDSNFSNVSINGHEFNIPETITSSGSSPNTLYPQTKWYTWEGLTKYPMKNSDGSYNVAVGPRILDPNYPDSGKIWASEVDMSLKIKCILKNKKDDSEKIIICVAKDLKAHTYNRYPEDGSIVKYNISSGLIQTGIAYPNSANAQGKIKGDSAYMPKHADSSIIEFCGSKVDFNPGDYKLVKVIVGEVNTSNISGKLSISSKGYAWPVEVGKVNWNHLTAGYLYYPSGGEHKGIDIGVGTGTPILAMADGIATSSYQANGAGYYVSINHGNGLSSLYMHFKEKSNISGNVVKGQQIGLSGNTGHSTGPHLHFEVRLNGTHTNPFKYVARPSQDKQNNNGNGLGKGIGE